MISGTVQVTEEIRGEICGHGADTACDATLIKVADESGGVLGRQDSGGCTFQTWIIGADGTTRLIPGYIDR